MELCCGPCELSVAQPEERKLFKFMVFCGANVCEIGKILSFFFTFNVIFI